MIAISTLLGITGFNKKNSKTHMDYLHNTTKFPTDSFILKLIIYNLYARIKYSTSFGIHGIVS